MSIVKIWFNYLFKRNPFLSQQEEENYVRKVLNTQGQNCLFENWLLKIIPKKGCIYIEMKSRKCGYIFGKRRV